jgi:DNA-binding transcriptional LysR family regulator
VLDLLKLKTFLVVAATSSFTRAGAELGYSQSNVTAHIQNLERELGAPLFDRFGGKVILTEIGRQMLQYAKRLLALAEEAKGAVRKHGNLTGPLSVSAPGALITYRLPPVLRQFQTLFPHVHLSITSCSDSRTQVDEVLNGSLDLAVIVDEPVYPEQVTRSCLGSEEILIVKAPHYEQCITAEPFDWKAFAAARILLTDRNCTFRLLFERALAVAQVPLPDTLELGTIEATRECAIAGMGLAVLPKMALTEELEDKRLVPVRWPGFGFAIFAQMIRHRERWVSPALYGLWSLLEQNLATGS